MPESQASATILLATYNGARFLPDQLQSIKDQDRRNWHLLVSDDWSEDDTRSIVTSFADSCVNGDTSLMDGPRQGSTRNFLSLVQNAPQGVPATFFCDQDDVWRPHKLSRAIDHLRSVPDGTPALYFSRSLICGPDLEGPRPSRLHPRGPGFANALVQNIASGNTMAFNDAALALLKQAAPAAENTVVHDWWAYQVLGGADAALINDPEPTVLYRQHGNNQISANAGPKALWSGLARVVNGDRAEWTRQNLSALMPVAHLFTSENAQLLAEFAEIRAMRTGPERWRRLRRSGLYCQKRRAQAALEFAALIGNL